MSDASKKGKFKLSPGAEEVLARAQLLGVSSVFGGLLVYLLQALWQFPVYPPGRSELLRLLSYGFFAWYVLYLLIAYLGEEFGVFGPRRGLRYAAFDLVQIAAAFGALYCIGFIDTSTRFLVADEPWRYAAACLGIVIIAGGGMLLAEKRGLTDSVQRLRLASLLAAATGGAIAFLSRGEERAGVLLVFVVVLLLVLLVYAVCRLRSAAKNAEQQKTAITANATAQVDAATLDKIVKELASIKQLNLDIATLRTSKMEKDLGPLIDALMKSPLVGKLQERLSETLAAKKTN